LSKELNMLLQRIHPLKPAEPLEPPKPSEYLLRLVGRVESRRWLSEELSNTKERLKADKAEIKWINHALECKECLIGLQIDIERYLGRQAPWYLDLTDEVGFDDEVWESLPEYYKDCPRVDNYHIGSYWNGASKDTIRFVKDRLNWALKIYEKEITVVKTYLRALKKWDLESALPPASYIYD